MFNLVNDNPLQIKKDLLKKWVLVRKLKQSITKLRKWKLNII